MRGHVGIETLANWVAMLRADLDGAILLVDSDLEGPFYERCAHPSSRVVPSPAVARALLGLVRDRNVTGVAAAISGPPASRHEEGVFQPRVGDVASSLLLAKSCDVALHELGGGAWMRACERDVGPLVRRLAALGWTIKLLYAEKRVDVPSDAYHDFIDWSTLEPNPARLVIDFEAEKIRGMFETARGMSVEDLLSTLGGMTVIDLLARATALFAPRGLHANRAASSVEVLAMLRVGFDPAELESDPMFFRIRSWERKNRPFRLLRDWRMLDPLQVLLDQRYWESDLRAMIHFDDGREGLIAMKIDLDNFKAVNEHLGHSAGDEAIRLAADILSRIFSSVGEVYRRGGDELVVLAPGLQIAVAEELAEALRKGIEERFAAWATERQLALAPTASIGLVLVPYGVDCREAIAKMDEAQASAKREGKNRVVCRTCALEEGATKAA